MIVSLKTLSVKFGNVTVVIVELIPSWTLLPYGITMYVYEVLPVKPESVYVVPITLVAITVPFLEIRTFVYPPEYDNTIFVSVVVPLGMLNDVISDNVAIVIDCDIPATLFESYGVNL